MPGVWNPSSPSQRAGAYFNFSAALNAALTAGVVGRTAVIGTADWGPLGLGNPVRGRGELEANYSSSTNGTLHDGSLAALEGFDEIGAGEVLAYRVAGSSAAAGVVTLKDGSAVDALTLTAKYKGVRANNFTVTVQTNGSNKDLILYESGVELERWENVTSGNNDAFATAINTTFPSQYVVAAVAGSSARALTNIVGTIGGSGGFASGNSGFSDLAVGDYTAALGVLGNQAFDSIALADLAAADAASSSITAIAVLDAFVAWLRDRNEDGKRTFGVIGGVAGESLSAAKARLTATSSPPASGTGYSDGKNTDGSYTYHDVAINLINLSTDLRRLADDVIFSSSQLAPRYAGALAGVGFSRSMTYLHLTGYQVSNPPSSYTDAKKGGVVVWANDTPDRVLLDNAVTALVTPGTAADTKRPASLQKARNVAITHFIENTLSQVAKDRYVGQAINNSTGRNDLLASFQQFLKDLENSNALVAGTSDVHLDDAFVQEGDAVYLAYEIQFQGTIERIFSSVRVR